MGIIRAVTSSVGGALADSWLEYIQPEMMGDQTVLTSGVAVRKNSGRGQNRKGSQNLISDGSIIEVGESQCMLLIDGGKVVDYSAEAGYYKVQNNGAPSIFNGQLEETVRETFNRVRFGGIPSGSQKVFYINTQEIKNIAFGTVNPINYFDDFYNAELYLRCHGYFSIRVVDPLKFYSEAIPKSSDHVEITDIHKLYLAEFLTALQTAINQMSVDGIRISHVTSKSKELSDYLSAVLDDDWTNKRGMIVESVGISSLTYDDDSKKLINMRNQGAMLGDPSIREGYVQGSVARGIEAAGSNSAGAVQGFMGVGMGMQGSGFMGAASSANQQQMQREQQSAAPVAPTGWTCECGHSGNSGKFCSECGKTKAEKDQWKCECGNTCTGKFCAECGKSRNTSCPECGVELGGSGKFCANCGHKL